LRASFGQRINGKAGISSDMAIRLEKAGCSSADHWLRLQTAHDLAQARKHQDRINVQRYEPHSAV